MNSRERFLQACHNKMLRRPPIWVMRQAGRYLPEYQALKEEYQFVEMVRNPEIACEVTLQPLERFRGLDAAILFSDILVIPEAFGQPYHFAEQGGIRMEYKMNSPNKIANMNPDKVREHLTYVEDAIKRVRRELGNEKALLGFGGSPWTLAVYMVEGGSSKHHDTVKQMCFNYPQLFEALMEKLTSALIDYFRMQIRAGVDAIQIFDSFANLCPIDQYWAMSLQWVQYITLALGNDVPVIYYARGMGHQVNEITRTGASVYGVDWTVSLPDIKKQLGRNYAIQGNLDPAYMSTRPEFVSQKATELLDSMAGIPGHIFNLGHGIMPSAKVECMEALVETVTSYEGRRA